MTASPIRTQPQGVLNKLPTINGSIFNRASKKMA